MSDPGAIGIDVSARRRGGTVQVELRLHIPEGAHIEAHEPAEPNLIPTVVEFENLDVTEVSYPEPVEKDLGLPGPPLLVYEGELRITGRGPADGALRTVRGTVRYQPCVGGACLPPRRQSWQAPLEVRALRPAQ